MTTNQISASYLALRGENCNLTNIDGVERLKTVNGIDLVTVGARLEHSLSTLEIQMSKIIERMNILEARGPGLQGPRGTPGATGATGLQGPKGIRGKVEKLQDVVDVDLNGLEDGSLLEWNASKKKWVVAVQ
jgi:hypothetical protein